VFSKSLICRCSLRGVCKQILFLFLWFRIEDDLMLTSRNMSFLILYIKLKVCVFVCLHLIQIRISEPILTRLCTHLPFGLEETVGTQFFLLLDLFHLYRERVHITGQKMATECRLQDRRWLPTQVIRDSLLSVILAGLNATSRKWRCSRRRFRVLTACCALGNA
jgi:hypothetical protein